MCIFSQMTSELYFYWKSNEIKFVSQMKKKFLAVEVRIRREMFQLVYAAVESQVSRESLASISKEKRD